MNISSSSNSWFDTSIFTDGSQEIPGSSASRSTPPLTTTTSNRSLEQVSGSNATSDVAGSPIEKSTPTRLLALNCRIRHEIHTERERVHWTDANRFKARFNHKMQSFVGLRSEQSKTKAFIKFMADGENLPETTTLALDDGWTRVSRRIKEKTALIDFLTNEKGEIVDARHPGKLPALPSGKEREAFSTVLQEIQSATLAQLHKVPVYYVNRNTRGYMLPTHGYVVAGTPGKGRLSGAVLYGIGGDPKRGQVLLDERLIALFNSKEPDKKTYRLSEPVRECLAGMAGENFATREDFYIAYREARGNQVDTHNINTEISAIYRLLPISTMELWPKRAGDYRAAAPTAPERDLRAFENLPQDIMRRVALKKMSNVHSLNLLESRQQATLHQLYQDELLGRNGTGIPSELFPPRAESSRRRALSEATPKFQRLPPHVTDKVGNCNSGAASLLQAGMDRYAMQNQSKPQKPKAASIFGIGSGHRIALWDPIKPDCNSTTLALHEKSAVSSMSTDG